VHARQHRTPTSDILTTNCIRVLFFRLASMRHKYATEASMTHLCSDNKLTKNKTYQISCFLGLGLRVFARKHAKGSHFPYEHCDAINRHQAVKVRKNDVPASQQAIGTTENTACTMMSQLTDGTTESTACDSKSSV